MRNRYRNRTLLPKLSEARTYSPRTTFSSLEAYFLASLAEALVVALAFVGSLYVWPRSRLPHARDEPGVIVQRSISVLFVCIMVWLWSGLPLAEVPPSSSFSIALIPPEIGIPPFDHKATLEAPLRALLVVAILFLGPLVEVLVGATEAPWSAHSLRSPLTWRALIWAPIVEELVFRALLLALATRRGCSSGEATLIAAVSFGIAHLHHLRTHGLVPVLLQLGYTTVFGILASSLFFRLRHVAGPIAAHVYCNLWGFPAFAFLDANEPRRVAIALGYVVGLAAFALLFPALTTLS